MSRAERIEVQCPQGGHQQEMTRWYSVNASMSPQAKAAVLSGQHHVFRCGKCSAQAGLDVEFMRHPHIVFDLDEMRRCIRFRDGLAECHEGQTQPAGGMGSEIP
jgi:hypothetical protein